MVVEIKGVQQVGCRWQVEPLENQHAGGRGRLVTLDKFVDPLEYSSNVESATNLVRIICS